MASYTGRKVVIIGKIGHGKTALLNKICDTNYASEMIPRSCTKELQHGSTKKYGIVVIDTPGFYSSEDIENHINVQRQALEGTYLSGVYIIVKVGRAADMADTLNRIMDFVGTDDVRIVVTHSDTIDHDSVIVDLKQELFELLDVPVEHIAVVGKETSSETIELFIKDTLHDPIILEVTNEQHAIATTFCVGARKFEQDVNIVSSQIDTLIDYCERIIKVENKQTVVKDIALYAVSNATQLTASRGIANIIVASSELIPEQKRILRKSIDSSIVSKQKRVEELLRNNYSNFSKTWGLMRFLEGHQFKVDLSKENSTWRITYQLDHIIKETTFENCTQDIRNLSKYFTDSVKQWKIKQEIKRRGRESSRTIAKRSWERHNREKHDELRQGISSNSSMNQEERMTEKIGLRNRLSPNSDTHASAGSHDNSNAVKRQFVAENFYQNLKVKKERIFQDTLVNNKKTNPCNVSQ